LACIGKSGGGTDVIAFLVLIIAVLVCGVVVMLGLPLAQSLVPMLPPDQQDNLPLLESMFSLVLFGGLLAVALIGGRLNHLNPLEMGRKPRKMIAIGLALGVFGIAVATLYAGINGTLSQGAGMSRNAPVLLWGMAIIFLQAASEEIYFRGWLQPVLARHWGATAAILASAGAFAALHLIGGARSPTTLMNLFLGGILFGFLARYGGGIAGAIAAHFAWNASEQILLGLDPNPGLGSFGSIYDLELSGASLWGGSDEGLNASIAMTFALCALIAPLLIMARGRKSPAASR
jgi:uncharacterized protein